MNISENKLFLICVTIIIITIIFSILYDNLEDNYLLKTGMLEECVVPSNRNDIKESKTILVRDCVSILKEYKENIK